MQLNRAFYLKLLGFVGATVAAAIAALNGDYVTAAGIMGASLSSAGTNGVAR